MVFSPLTCLFSNQVAIGKPDIFSIKRAYQWLSLVLFSWVLVACVSQPQQPSVAPEPPVVRSLSQQALAAIELGDWLSAESYVRRGLQIHPNSPSLYTRLAQIQLSRGDKALARKTATKAQSLGPSPADQTTIQWILGQTSGS